MQLTPLLLGIDIGTTNIKAIVFDPHGQIVSAASAKTPTHYPHPTWAYNVPDELWSETVATIKKAISRVEQPQRIVGVAVASMGEAAVSIDAHGQPTYDSIAWFDTRTEPQARWLAENIGAERLFHSSGLSLKPIFGLCKVLWLRENEPEAYRRTARWLNMADYIAFRLSGAAVTEYSLASRTLVLNLRQLRWQDDLLAELDIPVDLWGPLAGSGVKIGTLLPEVAAATGLPTSCVVATGGQDHVCGALPIGVNHPGTALDSLGTAEALFIPVAQPSDNFQSAQQGYEQGAHVSGGLYMMGGLTTSSACIEWFRNTMAPAADYAELIAEAEKAAQGSLGVTFMPHMRIAHPPIIDSHSRGLFLGLSTDATRGVLFRAVLEGLAMDYRKAFDPLVRYAGLTHVEKLFAIGGGTRNRLLMQIKADVLNRPYQIVSMDEATALGAAVLGGLGAGLYRDVNDAVTHMRYTITEVQPVPEQAELYSVIYEQVYQHIYPAVQALNHATYRIQHKSESAL